MKKIMFILLFFSAALSFALDCSVCGRKIRGNYIKDNKNNAFCSKKCFATTVPKCEYCKKPCTKGAFTFFKKYYCSKKCLNQVARCQSCSQSTTKLRIIINQDGTKIMLCRNCANQPKCYFCVLPYRTQQLNDGRWICFNCRKTAVTDPAAVQKHFKNVRNLLHKLFGFDPNHKIELHILTLPQLEKESKSLYRIQGGGRMALMRYEYEIQEKSNFHGKKTRKLTKQRCRMFVLSHTPLDLLKDAIAHELTHDYLRHNAGNISDLKIEEGFAEAIAAKYNDAVKKSHLNKRKQNNPDEVYGGGYRTMSKMLKERGFAQTMKYIKSRAKPIL
ncbi:MAG: hypothetical protein IKB71_05170 [Lentisphaeria bacterium]|nr:hypothetical protein [Lentisphaeria bacterium]